MRIPPHNCAPCRICGNSDAVVPLHNFGLQPVAGYLDSSEQDARAAPRFELVLTLCTRCTYMQQSNDSSHDFLLGHVYSHYQPTYSMSSVVITYVNSLLDRASAYADLSQGDLVMEVGSNDGSVLNLIERKGYTALGIEPSPDLCEIARTHGLTAENDFFGHESARRIRDTYGQAKLIITRHTLEHAFDPLDFLRGISIALAPDGLGVIEVPYVWLQMANNQFQSMTFQHVSFFSLSSLRRALELCELALLDAYFVEMDGGSVVAYVCKQTAARRPSPFVEIGSSLETSLALDKPDGYEKFFSTFYFSRLAIKQHLHDLAERKVKVLAYGAGSKGQALVNMLGLDTPEIPFAIDDTPGNAGRYIPGTGIQVISSDDPAAAVHDVIFITAPTHITEIISKETRRNVHCRFLTTVPTFHYAAQRIG